MDDAEQRLARIVCAATEEAVGDPAKARLLLSAEFRKARDFDLALALYRPYHDAALASAIKDGLAILRRQGKYSNPRGVSSTTGNGHGNGQQHSYSAGGSELLKSQIKARIRMMDYVRINGNARGGFSGSQARSPRNPDRQTFRPTTLETYSAHALSQNAREIRATNSETGAQIQTRRSPRRISIRRSRLRHADCPLHHTTVEDPARPLRGFLEADGTFIGGRGYPTSRGRSTANSEKRLVAAAVEKVMAPQDKKGKYAMP